MKSKHYITGLYGCSCHPFPSWMECDKYHKQRFKVGQSVTHRCLGRVGIVIEIMATKNWVSVRYGDLPRDLETEHVAMLELSKA
ncbi:hypothetical protein [Emticicia sp.]|uniref:hypothetical protein n=1 Tax=Emticicia sp. TaxID=1930953 RepID=UPI0037521037